MKGSLYILPDVIPKNRTAKTGEIRYPAALLPRRPSDKEESVFGGADGHDLAADHRRLPIK